jgi:hypothetical protein
VVAVERLLLIGIHAVHWCIGVGQTVLTRLRLEGNRIDEAHIRDVLADIEEKRQPPAVSFIPQHFVVAQQGTHDASHEILVGLNECLTVRFFALS